jgi:flagellin-like protein
MKGVSPIVASILVIALTVAVGAIVSIWGTGLVADTTDTVQENIEEFVDCGNTVLKVESVSCNEDGSLLGMWHFEENGGSVARDSSPNGRQINLTSPSWVSGKNGRALGFTGSNYGTVNGSESLSPAKFTIEAWVYKP